MKFGFKFPIFVSKVYFAEKGEKSKHTATNEKKQRSGNEPWTSCAFVTRSRNKFTPRRSHIGQYETPCRELTQCDLCAAREPTVVRRGSETFQWRLMHSNIGALFREATLRVWVEIRLFSSRHTTQ
jgi:hypothetical protein